MNELKNILTKIIPNNEIHRLTYTVEEAIIMALITFLLMMYNSPMLHSLAVRILIFLAFVVLIYRMKVKILTKK